MKRSALAFTLLFFASVGSAYIYDFNSLNDAGAVLNGQTGDYVKWVAIANAGLAFDVQSNAGDKYAHSFSSKQEQLVGTLSEGVGGTKPFYAQSTDTKFLLSYTGLMNVQQGCLIGIWIDGQNLDPNFPTANNAMASNNYELLCQFGVSSGKWRIRGANGGGSVNSDATGLAPANALYNMTVSLTIDLTGNGGDGSMSLSIKDLTNNLTYNPAAYQNAPMALIAGGAGYTDPSKWTSWWIRSQASAYDANVGGMTVDNLTFLPEPATLSLLVLGGLACIRRRR